MAINCTQSCELLPPLGLSESCVKKPRKGGISRFIVATCLVPDLSTLTSEEICNLIVENKIIVSPEIMGQKPAASTQSKRYSSCKPEEISNYEQSVTFQSYLLDEEYKDFDFYNDLIQNYNRYQFGYLTCDGMFVGFIPDAVFMASYIQEDTSQGNSYWEGSLKWNTGSTGEIKPVLIPDFLSNLLTKCGVVEGTCGQIRTDWSQGIQISVNQVDGAQTFQLPVYNYTGAVVTGVTIANTTVNGWLTGFDAGAYGVIDFTLTVPIGTAAGQIFQTTISIVTDCAGTLTIPLFVTLESNEASNFVLIDSGLFLTSGEFVTKEVVADGSDTFIGIEVVRTACTAELTIIPQSIQRVAGSGLIAPAVSFTDLDSPDVQSTVFINLTGIFDLGTWEYTYLISGCGSQYLIKFYVKVI